MSIISVSSTTSVKSNLRRQGSGGNMCVHGIQSNIGPSLPDESPHPTARISFASDTNFNSKPRSRITSKMRSSAINIRPIKVGESTHVTKFQVPKATASCFVNQHISEPMSEFVNTKDSYYWDYSKMPHYLYRSDSNLSEGNIFSDGGLFQGQGDPLQGHGRLFQGHGETLRGQGGLVTGHGGNSTRYAGSYSDRTYVKHDLNLGKKRDDLRMPRAQDRFPCVTGDRVSINQTSFWSKPSNDSSCFQHLPIYSHVRDSRPNCTDGRGSQFDIEYQKRLSHKYKCLECGKFKTSNDDLRWNLKHVCVCRYNRGSQRTDKTATKTVSENV